MVAYRWAGAIYINPICGGGRRGGVGSGDNPIWGCSRGRGRGMGSGGIVSILFQKSHFINYFPFDLGCPIHIPINLLHRFWSFGWLMAFMKRRFLKR